MKKIKMLSFIMSVMLCMTAFSVTAFAAESEVTAEKEFVIDLGEDIDLDAILDLVGGMIASGDITATDGMPLTPGGNLTLIDDILQIGGRTKEDADLPEKQFITLQSKKGNYFYLVIDRSGETENVYFMNLVDEADLMALLEDGKTESSAKNEADKCSCEDKCELGAVNGKCAICRINYTDCIGKIVPIEPTDTEDTDSKSNSGTVVVVILVLAVAAGVGVYLFKFRKPKDGKSVPDPDDYDYGEDDGEDDESEPFDADEVNDDNDVDEDGDEV